MNNTAIDIPEEKRTLFALLCAGTTIKEAARITKISEQDIKSFIKTHEDKITPTYTCRLTEEARQYIDRDIMSKLPSEGEEERKKLSELRELSPEQKQLILCLCCTRTMSYTYRRNQNFSPRELVAPLDVSEESMLDFMKAYPKLFVIQTEYTVKPEIEEIFEKTYPGEIKKVITSQYDAIAPFLD